MDETNPARKDAITSDGDPRNSGLLNSRADDPPAEDEDTSTASGITLGRRSLLTVVGAAAVSLSGCASVSGSDTKLSPFAAYGFGGTPVMQQNSQSVTVGEAEPNDRQATAMEVASGSAVSGSLTQSDSDYYAIELSSGSDLTIEFDRAAEAGVTAVVVFTPDGNLSNIRYVSSDEPLAFTETTEEAGTHYVQVVDTQNSAGDYTLALAAGSAPTETTTTTTPTSTETETSNTTTTTPTSTETETDSGQSTEDDYGEQSYGDYGYGGAVA